MNTYLFIYKPQFVIYSHIKNLETNKKVRIPSYVCFSTFLINEMSISLRYICLTY